jgi:hypothetical protein
MCFRTLIIAAWVILPATLNAQPLSAPETGNAASAAKPPPKTLSATVEEVVASADAGYKAIAYVVRWHGTRVLVEDPIARSRLNVGDSLNFFASHHDVGDEHLLSFIFLGPPCKCDDKSKPGPARGGSAAAKSAVGLVEEVLSTDDEGYRFVAYIVQAQGARIAVSDPLAQSHHVVGENISFLALSNNTAGNPVMTYLATPRADTATRAQLQTAQTKSEQTGVIEEVLSTNVDGFEYTAYVLNSLGSRIVIDDVAGAIPHRVGAQISFVSQRTASPNSSGPRILRFEQSAPEAAKQEDVNLSMTQETATVAEVLTTQTDGYRYVAYIVNWHGARVAVSDAFASSNYAVGDRINFPVSRATSPSGRQLSFLLFNFEKSAVPAARGK